MKRITNYLILAILLFSGNFAFSQTARVQIIHNSADAATALVDIYVNGTLLHEDFAFRTATPFMDVPAGIPLTIDVAPSNSNSSAESIYNIVTAFVANETYIIIANGLISTTGYLPFQPFELTIYSQGREIANDTANTDLLVCHGATDAPTYDIVNTTTLPIETIVDNISYPTFNSNYIEVPTGNYTIDVTDQTGNTVVASYDVLLQGLGLQGQAITIVASGFVNPSQNSNGPAFGLWVALPAGGNLIPLGLSQYARVQIIHNSPDLSASLVDVYVDGGLVLDDFAFRTATPFLDLSAGTPISIDIAPSNSTSVADSIYNLTTTFNVGGEYIVVANGIISSTGYAPSQPFALSIFDQGRETASIATNTDVLINHGSPDAPVVDIVETSLPAGTIVDNISYPNFTSGYVSLPTANYTLDVRNASGNNVVASYEANLDTLNLEGNAITVLASGFLNPSQNSNGPAFGLWAATNLGGNLIPLTFIPPPPSARVQIIHNSADTAAALVDVYLNGTLLLDDFAFRTATPFVDVPAETPIQIDIAPSTSASVAESIYTTTTTLTQDETYIIVANGIVSATGYAPSQPFGLSVFAQGRESASNNSNTDILVNHGSTDAPTVDVFETSIPAGTIVNDISYPNFNSGYLELPTADYTLEVRDETGTAVVATYSAPLSTLSLQGQAVTVVASGFLQPSQNSNGPEFGLWVALANGGNLIPLPLVIPTPTSARVQIIHNSADAAVALVDVYVNGTILLDDFAFRTATPFIDAPAETPIQIDIAPSTSASVSESIYTTTTTLTQDETYIIVANGIVSATGYAPSQPFGLSVFAQGRETASNNSNTDFIVNHGATDAPTVDIIKVNIPNETLVDDIAFGNFTAGYVESPTSNYNIDVRDSTGTTTVASYVAPFDTLNLQGQAITVVASGFLNPDQNSNGAEFGLWMALAAGGNLIELPSAPLGTETFSSSSISISPNPVSERLQLHIPFSFSLISGNIADMSGRSVKSFKQVASTFDVSNLASGMYVLDVTIDNKPFKQKFVVDKVR